jgi:hypothetical protein
MTFCFFRQLKHGSRRIGHSRNLHIQAEKLIGMPGMRSSDIKTKPEADAFLDKDSVSLINEVAKAVARQEAHVEKGE